MARISVVVPIYNVADYLPALVESLRRQDHQDFEVVLVDDESTDGSAEIASRVADSDPRWVHRLLSRAAARTRRASPGPSRSRRRP